MLPDVVRNRRGHRPKSYVPYVPPVITRRSAAIEYILIGDIVRVMSHVGMLPGAAHEDRLCELARVLDGLPPIERRPWQYR